MPTGAVLPFPTPKPPSMSPPSELKYIFFGGTPYLFETVLAFVEEAERTRKQHPRALYGLVIAARNRYSIEAHLEEFPADHVWVTDKVAGAVALALVPYFYQTNTAPQIGQHGTARQIKNAVDGLDCQSAGHREMLRVTLQGY